MKINKTWKIILCAIMSAILLLSLAACGGVPADNTEKENQSAAAQELERGENARNLGAYEKAIEYFQAAGEAGKEGLKQTILEFAENYAQMEFSCRQAAEPLAENIPSLISPEEGCPLLEKILWDWVAKESNSSSDYKDMANYAESMMKNGYAAEELQDEILYHLGRGKQDISDKKEIWSQAKEGTRCHSLATAIGLLQEGSLTEGAELLAQNTEYEQWAKMIYSDSVKEYRAREAKSLKETIEKAHAFDTAWEILCAMQEDPEDAERRAESSEQVDLKRFFNDHIVLVGINEKEGNIPLTEEDIQDMEALCGTAPNGKLILLHKRQIYNSDQTTTDVNLYHMDMLPEEFYPDSLEEVEFVVLMETTYRKTGRTYSGGTVEIRETTKLTLYNAVTGKKIFTASANSTPSSSLYYSGSAPVYYSGESPDMNKAMLKVLEKIRTDKTNQ